jgi:hypothetical protein
LQHKSSIQGENSMASASKTDFRFRELDALKPTSFVEAAPAAMHEIPALVEIAHAAIPAVRGVSAAVVAGVQDYHPQSVIAFKVKGVIQGGVGFLYFNERGLDALILDEIDFSNPDHALLAKPGEAPAALYIWAMACRGRSVAGTGTVATRFRELPFRYADYYVRPATDDGRRFSRELGFHPVESFQPDLWRYRRIANRAAIKQAAA